jgi:hypothetical protein
MKFKQQKKLEKLEAKFEALLDYLELECAAEEEGSFTGSTYHRVLITKKKKDEISL